MKPDPATTHLRILRCVWFDQSLDLTDLATDDGEPLRVLSPGWWNLEVGPAFRNAAVRHGTRAVVKGDVQVNALASDWAKLGYDRDCLMNGVVLFVCETNDTGAGHVTTLAGSRVPILTIGGRIPAHLL